MSTTQASAEVAAIRTWIAAALVALVASIAAGLLLAPPAHAGKPWEYPGRDGLNRRSTNDAPSRSIGCCGSTGPKSPVWQRSFDADITGTPIAARNGGLYVGDRDGVLRGILQKNGRTVCAQNVGNYAGKPSPITGSALYVDAKNTVYVVANKPGRPRLVALDPLNCDVKWVSNPLDTQANWEASDPTYSPLSDLIYVGTCVCTAERNGTSGVGGRGSVVAVNPDTGALVWKTYTVGPLFNGGAVAGTPTLHQNRRVYVATDHAFVGGTADPGTDAVLALDDTTGQIVASYQARPNDIATPSNLDPTKRLGFEAAPITFSSPVGTVIGAGDKGGSFYALDPDTLEPVLSTPISLGSSFGGIRSLSFDTRERVVHGVTAAPTLFFGISAKTGEVLYRHPGTDLLHYGPVSFASNAVWSADTAGFVDIQDPTNGRILGRLRLGSPSIGGVSFTERTAFVAIGSGDGSGGGLAAFR